MKMAKQSSEEFQKVSQMSWESPLDIHRFFLCQTLSPLSYSILVQCSHLFSLSLTSAIMFGLLLLHFDLFSHVNRLLVGSV